MQIDSITSKKTVVNLNDLPNGIYILSINKQVYKVIKQ